MKRFLNRFAALAILFGLWIAFADTATAADIGSPVPPLEKRVTDLEKRVADLEKTVKGASLGSTVPCICDECKCEDRSKCPAGCPVSISTPSTITTALDEVNAARGSRGLPPLVLDPGLTQAAATCAELRARHQLFGHTANDFAALPAGVSASSAGCAAYPPEYGWLSCCTYEDYTHGGAAYAMGADGKRYMHLFVRKDPGTGLAVAGQQAFTTQTCGPNGCTNCSARSSVVTSTSMVPTTTQTTSTIKESYSLSAGGKRVRFHLFGKPHRR